MRPDKLEAGPVPGLLVGRETQATLPVVDAATCTRFALPPPQPRTAGDAPTAERPPHPVSPRASSRVGKVSSRIRPSSRVGKVRGVSPAPGALEAAQSRASWVGLSLFAALSTLGLVAALGFELTAGSEATPELQVQGAPTVARHQVLGAQGSPTELDLLVFRHDVEPVLKQECWSCHGEAGAGEFRLRTGGGGLSVESVLPFVTAGRPEASLLLTKPLGGAWGGQPHASAASWQPDDPQVLLLERWIAGSSVPSRITPDDPENQ